VVVIRENEESIIFFYLMSEFLRMKIFLVGENVKSQKMVF